MLPRFVLSTAHLAPIPSAQPPPPTPWAGLPSGRRETSSRTQEKQNLLSETHGKQTPPQPLAMAERQPPTHEGKSSDSWKYKFSFKGDIKVGSAAELPSSNVERAVLGDRGKGRGCE